MSPSATLKQMREDSGMSLDDALVAIRSLLPEPLWISRATIARTEKDDAKVTQNLVQVAALVTTYGGTIKDLFPESPDELNSLRDLLVLGIGWLVGTPPALGEAA